MDTAKAQMLENWQNQNNVKARRKGEGEDGRSESTTVYTNNTITNNVIFVASLVFSLLASLIAAARFETDEFDAVASDKMEDEDWRKLGSFGIERNEEFDLDETFGEVLAGDTIEEEKVLTARMGGTDFTEIKLANQFMGFADFRAR